MDDLRLKPKNSIACLLYARGWLAGVILEMSYSYIALDWAIDTIKLYIYKKCLLS